MIRLGGRLRELEILKRDHMLLGLFEASEVGSEPRRCPQHRTIGG
jgi:hypothetical protein